MVISALALYLVFRKTGVEPLLQVVKQANFWWLLLAFLLFNLSKIASAYRLNFFFRALGLALSEKLNLRLYYVGMFYNLFLPGGIGGDGYKLLYLKRHYGKSGKKLFQALLIDRVSGLAGLCFLTLAMMQFHPAVRANEVAWFPLVAAIALLAVYPVLWAIYRWLFPIFIGIFRESSIQGIVVQLLQLSCAWALLAGVGGGADVLAYMIVFLISSIVTIVPFTVGGLGARELVFIIAADFAPINESTAVSLSLLFFLVTSASSFIGAFLRMKAPTEG